ncbi:hypothetical protein CHLNCDRAFT_58740 [Chlorella variabilis]|uniref:Poly A polymerase head domain-containing protein n=1 Tax=Chlorella variabilis TaxID=554065 RepID=E1ZMV5_CHLVA|nr:hypothetical protein CHLNCDRAFT_58740 [Chlorella variabilis]EFN52867.1 hypothetical protein CHLNCDRAFT_58740 [Chlorella variabilis]|eukprot:XP_005844969.1 hypothetical protein CHLNCDRAFT_58740 [Chlorella variabilis]
MWRPAGSALPQLLLQQLERAAGWAASRAVSAAPQASHLSTVPSAETLWQQTLRAAAAAVGGGGASGGAGQAALQAAHPSPLQLSQPPQQQQRQAADGWALAPPLLAPEVAELMPAGSRPPSDSSLAQAAAAGDPLAQLMLSAAEPARGKQRRRRKAGERQAEAGPDAAAAWAGLEPADDSASSSGSDGSSKRGEDGGPKHSTRAARRSRRKRGQQEQQAPAPGAAESASEDESSDEAAAAADVASRAGARRLPPPAVLQDDAHPIRDGDISRPAWLVLSRLRAAGHEAYVVGGTIRDLLLGGTPKDYDLLTTAELHQIKRLFGRCNIVGRSFPVCQVHAEGTMIEVSSFTTNADLRLIPADASTHMIGRQKPKRVARQEAGATWAAARADNAARRDFTVNGLLYDPFSRLLFDSVGGVADCQARRLRTICPPQQSFAADPARILRGVRLAARAGLELEPETAAEMEEAAATIGLLPQGRLQMELGSLLGYGASERSLALMWRLGLLDMLLPQHALYLKRHRVPRAPRAPSSKRRHKRDLLFELAGELDRHVHPQKPVDPSVWVALLAAPLVAEECARLGQQQRRRQRQKQRRVEEAEARRQQALRQEEEAAALDGEGSSEADGGGGGIAGGSSGYDSGSSSGSFEEEGQGKGEGEGEAPHRRQLQGWLGQEHAARQQYIEQYSQVVAEVLESMQQALDVATMETLGHQAKKHSDQLLSGGGAGTGGSKAASRRRRQRGAEAQGGVLLPCVLSKAALDRAAALLLLEADLRGHPELLLLLGKGSTPAAAQPAPAAAVAALPALGQEREEDGERQQQEQQAAAGRHNEQHQLWHRLERALAVVELGQAQAADAAAATAAADAQRAGAEAQLRRRRQGRRLSPEERLVLGILSDPRFDYGARTALLRGGAAADP